MEQSPQSAPDSGGPTAAPVRPPARRNPIPVRLAYAFSLFMAGLGVGAAAVHFGLQQPVLDAAHVRLQQYEQDLAALRGHLDEAGTVAAALEGRLRVEESTRRSLEATLGSVQTELGRARDTLAFYEQLMPPGPAGAISIRALDVDRAGPHLKYRMLLMRSTPAGDKPFQGELQFTASGRLNGEEVRVPLAPAIVSGTSADAPASESDDTALTVQFSEFQRSSGLLGLPEGFEPESVTVNVLEGRALRVSRSIELPAGQ